jgi:hypothetical protein
LEIDPRKFTIPFLYAAVSIRGQLCLSQIENGFEKLQLPAIKSIQALKSGSQSESSLLSSLSIFRFRFLWDFFLLLLLFSPLGDLGVFDDFDRGVFIGVVGAPISVTPGIIGGVAPKTGAPIAGTSVGTGDSVT